MSGLCTLSVVGMQDAALSTVLPGIAGIPSVTRANTDIPNADSKIFLCFKRIPH